MFLNSLHNIFKININFKINLLNLLVMLNNKYIYNFI